MCIHVSLSLYIYIYICMYMCVYIYIYIHIIHVYLNKCFDTFCANAGKDRGVRWGLFTPRAAEQANFP